MMYDLLKFVRQKCACGRDDESWIERIVGTKHLRGTILGRGHLVSSPASLPQPILTV
jgi:hypothetical protein